MQARRLGLAVAFFAVTAIVPELPSLARTPDPESRPFGATQCSASAVLPNKLTDRKGVLRKYTQWTIASIIEVRRVTSLSVMADGSAAAFILRQSCVYSGKISYGLYVSDLVRDAGVA